MDEIKKSRDDIRLRLRKKEWEYESRVMERDQQRSNVEKLKIKMNRKAAELNEAWNREQELRERSTKLQVQVIKIDVIVEGYTLLDICSVVASLKRALAVVVQSPLTSHHCRLSSTSNTLSS